MSPITEAIVSALLLIGAAFALVGSIGLYRLPDIFMRLHGPTKATTLGIGSIVVALIVHATASTGRAQLAELAVSLFIFITAPVTAHLVAKAAFKAFREAGGQSPDGGTQRGKTGSGAGSEVPSGTRQP